jgi:hypothetical protein
LGTSFKKSLSKFNPRKINLETSAETVRKSVNKEKTFVKWEGITPSCVENLQTKEGKYDYDQMVAILNTEEWSPNILILP